MNPVPPGHPSYIATVAENVAALEAVTLDEARAFPRDFYGPQLGTLAVVGDFDSDEIRGVIEEAFGAWESPYPATRISTEFFDAPCGGPSDPNARQGQLVPVRPTEFGASR